MHETPLRTSQRFAARARGEEKNLVTTKATSVWKSFVRGPLHSSQLDDELAQGN